jgi:hypothetical protein
MTGFSENGNGQQLVHIATDGETYGHHHRFGDMALAFALNQIESRGVAKLTNYGEFLAKFPPAFEVEIFENGNPVEINEFGDFFLPQQAKELRDQENLATDLFNLIDRFGD